MLQYSAEWVFPTEFTVAPASLTGIFASASAFTNPREDKYPSGALRQIEPYSADEFESTESSPSSSYSACF
jgi:hypothetical protein